MFAEPYTTFLNITAPTYTWLVGFAITLSIGQIVLFTRSRGAALDVCLGALVGGIVLARAQHVALHWAYFQHNSAEIVQLSAGGLSWHGAVIGGVFGALLLARWRKLDTGHLLALSAPLLPLIALGAWWGCRASLCAYGAEVPTLIAYPAWLVGESADVFGILAPRFQVQTLGMVASGVLLVFAGVLQWRGWFTHTRFWLLLALISFVMFWLGFLRGDAMPHLYSLRVDQWLDVLVCGVALVLMGRQMARS